MADYQGHNQREAEAQLYVSIGQPPLGTFATSIELQPDRPRWPTKKYSMSFRTPFLQNMQSFISFSQGRRDSELP